LTCVPGDTTPDRALRRLDDAVMAPALSAALHQLPAPPEGRGTAVDATGGASGAISTFVVKRAKDAGEGYPRRHWLQWTVAVDSGRRLVVVQVARHGFYKAGATPRPLLDAASPRLPVGLVLSNAACDRERHHQDIRHHIGADRVIPCGIKSQRMSTIRRGLWAMITGTICPGAMLSRAVRESRRLLIWKRA
jgi:hypothetical protein